MAEHTPGPWHTGTDEDAHIVYDNECGFVADVTTDDGDAERESANARLIAAAPDLLAACRCFQASLLTQGDGPVVAMHGIIDRTLKRHGWDGEEPQSDFLRRLCCDALEKVKGGE